MVQNKYLIVENSPQLRPFAARHSRGTRTPRWRAKVAPGQDKQKSYIILNGNFLCLSCPSATFTLQHGGFGPREWLVNRGYFLCKFDLDIVYQNSHKNLGGLVQFDLKL